MARPQKQTVEYFAHDATASDGKTLSVLFNHFGHEGLSAWWLLLERISKTRNHVININNGEDIEFLAAKMHFKPERLKEILAKMAELDAIDADLYKGGLVWCQNFVNRLEPVYKYRKQPLPTKPELPTKETALLDKETALLIPEIPQSKESKVKDSKIPPIVPQGTFCLPDWIKKENWSAFTEMRTKLRAPLTERAKALIVSRLSSLRAAGDDPNEVLNQSVMNSWKGVFPLKEAKNERFGENRPKESAAERADHIRRSIGAPLRP